MDGFDRLTQLKKDKAERALEEQRDQKTELTQLQTQEVIVRSFKMLVDYLDARVSKTNVVNQLREIGTPDVAKVVTSLDSLHKTIQGQEAVDLSEITGVLRDVLKQAESIPKEYPEFPEIKLVDNTKQLESLAKTVQAVEKAVKAQKLIAEAPIVHVPAPKVDVEAPNLVPIDNGLKDILKAVKAIVIPEFKTDNAEVEKQLKNLNKKFDDLLEKPFGGGGGGGGTSWVTINTAGTPVPIELEADGSLPTVSPALATRIDDTTTLNITYIGKAVIGSATSAAVWQIAKLDTSSGLIKTWADASSSFSQIWDNRVGLSYA